jgi:hypothetical protein
LLQESIYPRPRHGKHKEAGVPEDSGPVGCRLLADAVLTLPTTQLILGVLLQNPQFVEGVLLVIAIEAEIDSALVAAVGALLVGGNLRVGLPYNGVAGHWSYRLLWSEGPGAILQDSAGAFAFLLAPCTLASLSSFVNLCTLIGVKTSRHGGV